MRVAWKTIAVLTDFPADRLWHAGLDDTGRLCVVASTDEDLYVFDVHTKALVAAFDDRLEDDDPLLDVRPLAEMLEGDRLPLRIGEHEVRFRIFGLDYGDGLTQVDGWTVAADPKAAEVVFASAAGEQRLPYDDFSGDFAYVSFAASGRVAAVIEPYEVRIFELQEPAAG